MTAETEMNQRAAPDLRALWKYCRGSRERIDMMHRVLSATEDPAGQWLAGTPTGTIKTSNAAEKIGFNHSKSDLRNIHFYYSIFCIVTFGLTFIKEWP